MDLLLASRFVEVLVWIVVVFFWMLVIWMFIAVFTDIFRRHDISGWVKAFWVFFIFILPLIGILVYLIARPKDATREQDMQIMAAQQRASGYYATEDIAKAKALLDAGTITQAEFDEIKRRALA